MLEKIKSYFLSKTNIISISLSTYAFLSDIQDVITGFASRLYFVAISLFVLIAGLIIHLKMTSKEEKDNEHIDSSVNLINEDSPNNYSSLKPTQKLTLFSKIIFATILFITIMTLGSLNYIRNLGVYYVVIEKGLTKNQAINLNQELNSSSHFKDAGISTRFIEIKDGKYEIILYNGYISKSKANKELAKIKSLNLGLKPYRTGPQYVTNYFKKLKYLQYSYFN